MLIISDSFTFLLEKTFKSRNISIEKILKLNPDSLKEISNNYDSCLLLLSESFYSNFEIINKTNLDKEKNIQDVFALIDIFIEKLSSCNINIYIPFIPKHFIFRDRFRSKFLDIDSNDLFIQSINNKLFYSYHENHNVIFINGIIELSEKICKTYFRFSSIYDEENSKILIEQIEIHKHTIYKEKKKLIILDLDNTLWKGILGDDSIDGISIDKSDPIGAVYRCVQSIFLNLKKDGFLLAICSKNEEDLALKALFSSSASIITKEDIVSYRINWRDKSENILEICQELNIALNHVVFVDDSDYECEEVRTNCEGISVFKVPKNKYRYPYLLSCSELFFSDFSTEEDIVRTEMYKKKIKQNKLFNDVINKKKNKVEWIKSLEVELKLEKIKPDNKKINRIIQLFNRTNQFNLSESRYNISKFNNNLQNKYIYYAGTSSDRLGNDGLISVVGFKHHQNSLLVIDYILSCRVFGKYLEESMLFPLFEYALKNECDIYFKFIENKKNIVIKNFLSRITSNNYYLKLENIKNLKEDYEKLPIKIITL